MNYQNNAQPKKGVRKEMTKEEITMETNRKQSKIVDFN